MPKYLIEIRYNAEGVKGVMREGGAARREAAVRGIESVGGKLEALYFAFGDIDAYCLCELPDDSRALAISMALNQSGVMSAKLTPLMAPEAIDAATKVSVSFRPAGQ